MIIVLICLGVHIDNIIFRYMYLYYDFFNTIYLIIQNIDHTHIKNFKYIKKPQYYILFHLIFETFNQTPPLTHVENALLSYLIGS